MGNQWKRVKVTTNRERSKRLPCIAEPYMKSALGINFDLIAFGDLRRSKNSVRRTLELVADFLSFRVVVFVLVNSVAHGVKWSVSSTA